MHQGGQEVVDRKLKLCLKLQKFEIEDLILTCGICGHFFLYCCPCSREDPQLHERPCHHLHLVFTDGACSNNGRPNATAGAGIAYGSEPGSQHDIPITETSDSGQRRTSQRAELWAATYGLAFVKKAARRSERLKTKEERATNPDGQSEDLIIIATDSEYVVKGMTQWLPTWKVSNFLLLSSPLPQKADVAIARRTRCAPVRTKSPLTWTCSFVWTNSSPAMRASMM